MNLNLRVRHSRAEDEAADAAEPVDSHLRRHLGCVCVCKCTRALAWIQTAMSASTLRRSSQPIYFRATSISAAQRRGVWPYFKSPISLGSLGSTAATTFSPISIHSEAYLHLHRTDFPKHYHASAQSTSDLRLSSAIPCCVTPVPSQSNVERH